MRPSLMPFATGPALGVPELLIVALVLLMIVGIPLIVVLLLIRLGRRRTP